MFWPTRSGGAIRANETARQGVRLQLLTQRDFSSVSFPSFFPYGCFPHFVLRFFSPSFSVSVWSSIFSTLKPHDSRRMARQAGRTCGAGRGGVSCLVPLFLRFFFLGGGGGGAERSAFHVILTNGPESKSRTPSTTPLQGVGVFGCDPFPPTRKGFLDESRLRDCTQTCHQRIA